MSPTLFERQYAANPRRGRAGPTRIRSGIMGGMSQERSASRLGRSLRKARRNASLTQAALGTLAGCDERTVRQSELGLGRADVFLRMAVALGCAVTGRSLPPGDHLGARLMALRIRTGRSRRGVAAACGVSATTITAIEDGRPGHLAAVERVADALGAGLVLASADHGQTFYTGLATSSAWDAWSTPQAVLDPLYGVLGGGFDLDPCSPGRCRCRVDARRHFDKDDDGLAHPWFGRVYMNPPYGRVLAGWVAKTATEVREGRADLVVGLVPARTDTLWWHTWVASCADVWLLRRRLSFGDGLAPAPFPSALALWGGTDGIRRLIGEAFPQAWHVALDRRPDRAIPDAGSSDASEAP